MDVSVDAIAAYAASTQEWIEERKNRALVAFADTKFGKQVENIAKATERELKAWDTALSNNKTIGKAYKVARKYAPVIGKICMDYFMADISNVPDVKEGDYAILLGVDGENEVSAMELGGVNQTAPGDVTCAISARVPRIYFPALLE